MLPFGIAEVAVVAPCEAVVMVEVVVVTAVDVATIARYSAKCGKTGHSALRCYKRFNANYSGEEKYANAATTGYSMDT
jgi:hypothetical protein